MKMPGLWDVRRRLMGIVIAAVALAGLSAGAFAQTQARNVVLFVADGLRHGAADTPAMPTMGELRKQGVDFVNSHSVFPTFTMPNAAVIATGHYPGDTGVFSNSPFLGYPSVASDAWSAIHSIEDDMILPDINDHFAGNFVGEESLLAAARRAGFNTAVIGKHGPALMQDVTRNNGTTAETVHTVVIDDRTGAVDAKTGEHRGVPLPRNIAERIANDPYFQTTYYRGQAPVGEPTPAPRGPNGSSGTRVANVQQQRFMIDATTRAILPTFVDPAGNHKPFVLVYWSRDPDGTQHNEGDSPDTVVPGINGPTVQQAFENVDSNLKQLVEYLKATSDPNAPEKKLWETTDLFITSDHGFGTISRGQIDAKGSRCETFATQQRYRGVREGDLPPGFLAIDLAHDLGMPLYDADVTQRPTTQQAAEEAPSNGPVLRYRPLRITAEGNRLAEFPSSGHAFIGGNLYDKDGFTAPILISANGGSDVIYMPPVRKRAGETEASADHRGAALARRIVASLADKPYVSGIFVDSDRFGPIPGALGLSDLNLFGSARTPVPAMYVNFRSFATDPKNPEMSGVEVSDTGSRQGQGMHGSFGRQDIYNCMIAIGPDFKTQFADSDPVSNADIAMTLSKIMGLDLSERARGRNTGRVLTEAMIGGAAPRGSERKQKVSTPAPNGLSTVLNYQIYTNEAGRKWNYCDVAGFPGRSVGLPE